MFGYDFMRTASGVAAVLAGILGFFLVLRGQTFAGHALSHVGSTGATGAVLFGLSPLGSHSQKPGRTDARLLYRLADQLLDHRALWNGVLRRGGGAALRGMKMARTATWPWSFGHCGRRNDMS